MTKAEKIKDITSIISRVVYDIMPCPEPNADIWGVIAKDYVNSYEVEELGTESRVVRIKELDIEVLYFANKIKYLRVGHWMRTGVEGSHPIELVTERVDRLLKQYDTRLTFYDGGVAFQKEMMNTDGELVKIDSRYYYDHKYFLLEDRMKANKPMTNREGEIKAWIKSQGSGDWLAVDEKLVKLVGRFEGAWGETLKECDDCGILVGSRVKRCPICHAKGFECNNCGEFHDRSEAVYIRARGNDYYICAKCNELPRCVSCGRIMSNKEKLCAGCHSHLEEYRILDYHSSIGRQDFSEGSRFKIGFEIEKEDQRVRDYISTLDMIEDTGWVVERDGSLNDSGFEMISPVLPLDIDKIIENTQPLIEYIDCESTSNCGGHIHISDTESTPYEILSSIRGYLPLLYSLYPNRSTNSYCEAKEVDSYLMEGHRQAINITSKTLEFRIFPAVKNIYQLIFRARILEYMLTHPERDVISVGKSLLNKDSSLYRLLVERIGEDKLRKRANLFIDYANWIDRDSLMLKDNDIERVLPEPVMKIEKMKKFESEIQVRTDEIRNRNERNKRFLQAGSDIPDCYIN